VLARAGAERARAVVAMIRRPTDVETLLERVGEAPVFVRVFTDEDASAVEALGAIPVRYAEAAAEAFLGWFEERAGSRRAEEPA
jgi:hypothetical protein